MISKGTLYVISAPSGAGKTTLAQALSSASAKTKVSISYTTRPIRAGEVADQSYFFVNEVIFNDMVKCGDFLEYARVFGHYYGTSRKWVEEQLGGGVDVILSIDWQGARQIRKLMNCISIFLLPPSLAELRMRLEKRKREDIVNIENRLSLASSEIAHYKEFDYIVVNDRFEDALEDLKSIIRSRKLQYKYQAEKYDEIVKKLL